MAGQQLPAVAGAGMRLVVCDASSEPDKRIARVFWNDPGTEVMRHADAGYEIARQCAREMGLKLPMV